MHVRNLPAITPRYWTAILVASMCGANTGDFLSRNLHLGHTRGLLPLAVAFSMILWAERRAKITTEVFYWLAIIVLRTGATNLADLATHDLALGYGATIAGLSVLLVLILIGDGLRGKRTNAVAPRPIDSRQTLPATDLPYWAAMLTAGTLGTAAGDFVADAGLGLGYGSLALALILGIVLFVSEGWGGMSKPWYWASIVAARTAGTTMGDFIASRHGLNFGLTLSTTCTACLLTGILIFWRDRELAVREV